MIPYIIFAVLLFLLYKKQLPLGMTLLLVLFAVFRYDTGWDYMSYYNVCTDYTALSISQNAWGKIWSWWFELMYDKKNPFVGIGVPALLTNISIAIAFRILFGNDKKRLCEALLIYGLWPFLYLQSFCVVRQFLAIGLSVLGFALFYKKQYIVCIASYLLAIALHPSSAVAILFPIILKLKHRLSFSKILTMSVVAVILFGSMAAILNSLGLMGYVNLLESNDDFGGKISFVYLALAIFLLLAVSKNKDTDTVDSKILSLLSICVIVQFLIYVSPVPSVVSRGVLYGLIFLPISFGYSINIVRMPLSKNQIYIIMMLFMFVYLLITKDSPDAASQYVPYKTIWDL